MLGGVGEGWRLQLPPPPLGRRCAESTSWISAFTSPAESMEPFLSFLAPLSSSSVLNGTLPPSLHPLFVFFSPVRFIPFISDFSGTRAKKAFFFLRRKAFSDYSAAKKATIALASVATQFHLNGPSSLSPIVCMCVYVP